MSLSVDGAVWALKDARFAVIYLYSLPKRRGRGEYLENTAEFRIPTRRASPRGQYAGSWFTACFRWRESFDGIMHWFVRWHWDNRERLGPFTLQFREVGSDAAEPCVIGYARWGVLILEPDWCHIELPYTACSLEDKGEN